MPIQPRDMDLAEQLRAILDELDDASPGWQLELHVDGDARGRWDGDRLAQVFSNLVANAIQHGDVSAGVRVSVDGTARDGVRVVVENAGRIPESVLPALFEPMTRGATRREGARGLGLGLYITKQIVEAHRGRIEATSGDTTRFVLWLPRELA
jgi:signal transduction histidine kinase